MSKSLKLFVMTMLLASLTSGCAFGITGHGLMLVTGNGYAQSGDGCPTEDIVDEEGVIIASVVTADCTQVVSNGFSMPFVNAFLAPIGQAINGAVAAFLGFFGKTVVPGV